MLPLPISVPDVLTKIIGIALDGRFRSPAADVMMLASGGQESGFKVRRQYGNGPASGLWQFERGGGCVGVLTHPASRSYMEHACSEHRVPATPQGLWTGMLTDDLLAAKAARLLLWTDPRSLPMVGDEQAAWNYYVHNWRPGKPDRSRWTKWYRAALDATMPCR